jgi:uncharacterized membrane protein
MAVTKCPECGSTNIEKRNHLCTLIRIGVGSVAGWVAGTAAAEEIGATLGAIAGPLGAAAGAIIGALAGAYTGAKFGSVVKESNDILNSKLPKFMHCYHYHCNNCGHNFSEQ